jgi:hypothetical protein
MAEYSVTGFAPLGNSISISASTSAPTAIQAPTNASVQTSNLQQFRLVNSGANTVFANAVLITSSQASVCLLPGSVEVFSFPMNSYFTGLTSTGTSVVYIVPGQGL